MVWKSASADCVTLDVEYNLSGGLSFLICQTEMTERDITTGKIFARLIIYRTHITYSSDL